VATGLNRQVGTIIDTTATQYHKYLFATITSGLTITRIRTRTKMMFAAELDISEPVFIAYWSHSIGWVPTGDTPPPFPSAAPSDDSILAFDLFEPNERGREFWAPGNASLNSAESTTETLEWRGQWKLTQTIDLYYLQDNNSDATIPASSKTVGWQVWYH
jgi:hypothetical protein